MTVIIDNENNKIEFKASKEMNELCTFHNTDKKVHNKSEMINEAINDEELSSDELNDIMKYILLKDYFKII